MCFFHVDREKQINFLDITVRTGSAGPMLVKPKQSFIKLYAIGFIGFREKTSKTLPEVNYTEETHCKFKNKNNRSVFFRTFSPNHCDSKSKRAIYRN